MSSTSIPELLVVLGLVLAKIVGVVVLVGGTVWLVMHRRA